MKWFRFFAGLFLCFNLTNALANELSEDELERQLAQSLQALSENKLNVALRKVDDIIRTNPKFKLAQLVRGDLLLAYSGKPIRDVGNISDAPQEQLDDLRAEAQARIRRIMEKEQAQRYVPRYLWQLNDEQKYVIVADTSRSALYIYENINGEARYVADYYLTIGKLGSEKSIEGDQRTPLGVYTITSFLSRNKLNEMYGSNMADLYGTGAFPINYPNDWDKRNGRTGQGIWIHGTPSDTYSRPPRASNGCLVLSNDNLDKIAPYIQQGVTPVIVSERIEWATKQDFNDRQNLLSTIDQWRRDWQQLDTDAFLSHYSENFFSDQGGYRQWIQQKQNINQGKKWVKLALKNMSVFVYPNEKNMVIVEFALNYSSNNRSDNTKKRQYWVKQGNTWKILYEGNLS